jgi:hypothetical protein
MDMDRKLYSEPTLGSVDSRRQGWRSLGSARLSWEDYSDFCDLLLGENHQQARLQGVVALLKAGRAPAYHEYQNWFFGPFSADPSLARHSAVIAICTIVAQWLPNKGPSHQSRASHPSVTHSFRTTACGIGNLSQSPIHLFHALDNVGDTARVFIDPDAEAPTLVRCSLLVESSLDNPISRTGPVCMKW